MLPGQPLIILSDDGIESPILRGKVKKIRWNELVDISIETVQNNSFLKFRLTDTPEHPNKSPLLGSNPSQLTMALNPFSDEDQKALLTALQDGMQHLRTQTTEGMISIAETLAAEREFETKLKALTPIPWITYLLVAANVLVWVAAVYQGASAMQIPTDILLQWGGNAASEVQRGEWWRLLTATFLHGGIMHLLMNMLGLISVGITVERIYGHRLYTLIYFSSGVLGSSLSLHYSAQTAVSVGASGAIFGVAGALLVAVYQHRDKLPSTFSSNMISSMTVFILYSLLQGFAKQGIDNSAHIGGLLAGMTLAYLLPERFDMEHFLVHWKKRAVTGTILAVVATLGLTVTAPSAAIDQRRTIEGQAALLLGMKDFGEAAKALQQDQDAVRSGRMSKRESDDRSRTVLAPLFRKVQQDFATATLPANDPRFPLMNEMKRLTDLFEESLAMSSSYEEGGDNPKPADPQRMAEIESDIKATGTRIQQITTALKQQRK